MPSSSRYHQHVKTLQKEEKKRKKEQRMRAPSILSICSVCQQATRYICSSERGAVSATRSGRRPRGRRTCAPRAPRPKESWAARGRPRVIPLSLVRIRCGRPQKRSRNATEYKCARPGGNDFSPMGYYRGGVGRSETS